MYDSILPERINSSWERFLTRERLDVLEEIGRRTGESVNPSREKILRFLKVDISAINVVILGQDPYPQMGMATGRAFEVGGLNSWQQSFRQVSLKNIVRLLYKNYKNIHDYNDICSFNQIKDKIQSGSFPILPPDKLFVSWENQGVLLLNTSFSCEPGVPGSHMHLWEDFSKQLISFISNNKNLHWFLWGKNAAEQQAHIRDGTLHISRHPMLCSQKYNDDFLKSTCFLETWHLINWV